MAEKPLAAARQIAQQKIRRLAPTLLGIIRINLTIALCINCQIFVNYIRTGAYPLKDILVLYCEFSFRSAQTTEPTELLRKPILIGIYDLRAAGI